MKIPGVIYLQWWGDDGDVSGNVTWCEDRINDSDIKYCLADEELHHSYAKTTIAELCTCSFWKWLSRLFLSCDGNSCGGYVEPQLLFVPDADGLFPVMVKHGGIKKYSIYVYYCPWCGRKLRAKSPSPAGPAGNAGRS